MQIIYHFKISVIVTLTTQNFDAMKALRPRTAIIMIPIGIFEVSENYGPLSEIVYSLVILYRMKIL